VSFGRPLLLLALLVPLAAAVVFVALERRPTRYPVSFTNLDVLAAVGGRPSRWRRYVPPALFLLALTALCAALARPHVTTRVLDERATVILVIDASRSMESVDVKPSRLVAAEAAAKEFLDRVPGRLRVALIVFSGDVQVAAPPTTEHALVREAIDEIGEFSGFGGTAIGDALARAVEVGEQAVAGDARMLSAARAAPPRQGRVRGLVSIVFLSDGRQNRGVLPPLEGAARARAAGIRVYTIALGTRGSGGFGPGGGLGGRGGGPGSGFGFRFGNRAPDPQTLRAIARITGGEFFQAKTAGSVKKAYSELGSHLGRTNGRTEVTYAFLIAAAVLLLGSGVASAAWSQRLP
jgi:Ca-activated chloride channel homolog